MIEPLLVAKNITKTFPGTQALDNVTLDLLPGEIHALVGENGAGKSTLMNILSGVLALDSGQIDIAGHPVQILNPKHAQELGVGTVFQELSLVPSLSIAENVFANRAPLRAFGTVDWSKLYQRTRELMAPFDVNVDVRTLVRDLNVGTKQLVEIAKALSLNARILLLDEPTSALTPDEVQHLFGVIRRLQADQIGIVYISHRMREVFEIADRVTVLRDGRRVGTYPISEANPDNVIRLMVGRELAVAVDKHAASTAGSSGVLLRVQGLSSRSHYRDISFSLRRGEIVGIAGLKGSGRSDLGHTLAGVEHPQIGQIWIEERPVKINSPVDAVALGIGYLPEERKIDGLFLQMTVSHNISVTRLRQFARWGLMDRRKENAVAQSLVERLGIRTPSVRQTVGRLSGGNQQKVMLSKWLVEQPKILVIDEPTKGVDVGAKAEIHSLLRKLADQGVGILFISSELPEILALSDRILVMHEGRLTGELQAARATEEHIMALASGHTARPLSAGA